MLKFILLSHVLLVGALNSQTVFMYNNSALSCHDYVRHK